MKQFDKWVACWGNATSITDQKEAMYAKDVTLRYPIEMCFDADALRLHFSNLTGKEPVTLTKIYIGKTPVTFRGELSVTIKPGNEVVSDEISYQIKAGSVLNVSIYLGEFTQMNAGTLITGPMSQGFYSYGDYATADELPAMTTRGTNWFYFLNTIDVRTEQKNRALVCYGDSITAQSWPDYLMLRIKEEGYNHVSVIRRAVSGTRILRQYDCITYAAYGLKGEIRFPIEMNVAGAKDVIIQHGINDIIHPVGTEVNQFRPMSDLPTAEELARGVKEIYVEHARKLGYGVWSGTLLPIEGWRTYADFREEIRGKYNKWLRTSDIFDGCVDFDAALRDPKHPVRFKDGYDSGDHLHPSEAAYKKMAETVPVELLV